MAQYGAFFSLETMGDTSPTVIEHYNQTQGNAHKGDEACTKVPTGGVGKSRLSHGLTLFVRVARVQGQIERLRPVPDADLLQHAADLTALMWDAWNAFLDTGNSLAQEHYLRRQRQIRATRRLLSRDWLAQYEQQNACYFCAAGEADRLAREGAAA
jgi:hypothetical protein